MFCWLDCMLSDFRSYPVKRMILVHPGPDSLSLCVYWAPSHQSQLYLFVHKTDYGVSSWSKVFKGFSLLCSQHFFPLISFLLRVVASDIGVFLTSEAPRWLDQFEACVRERGDVLLPSRRLQQVQRRKWASHAHPIPAQGKEHPGQIRLLSHPACTENLDS